MEPHEAAIAFITSNSGEHFDPAVVEALVQRGTSFVNDLAAM